MLPINALLKMPKHVANNCFFKDRKMLLIIALLKSRNMLLINAF